MMTLTVTIDAGQIVDSETFHVVFAEAFGFPEFYGHNLDAWIDCMTQLDQPFSAVQVGLGQLVTLKIEQADDMKERLPELYATLLDLAAFVNWRRIENGHAPVLVVAADG
jgi:RNAse (barnase) inhibitor barstar